MSLAQIMEDHAVAMTIVRMVAQSQWSDLCHAHLISRDVVTAAQLLLAETSTPVTVSATHVCALNLDKRGVCIICSAANPTTAVQK